MEQEPKADGVNLAEVLAKVGVNAPLDANECGAFVGVHPRTVLRYARENGLPAHRIAGRQLRFIPDEVRAWIESHGSE